jgi:hypothetical protein
LTGSASTALSLVQSKFTLEAQQDHYVISLLSPPRKRKKLKHLDLSENMMQEERGDGFLNSHEEKNHIKREEFIRLLIQSLDELGFE